MSCIVFKLPSSIAVLGVPLQLFLLAVCWQNNSCYCITRIDFHRTAPSKAYLQATTLQQNINAVSFSAFFRREKKKHFQQSSTQDAIYSGHTEDKMLIFKGLNLSSISPSPTNRGKKSCPQISLCKAQNLKIGVCVLYLGLYREATFCRSGKVGCPCSHVPSEAGRFRKGAQVYHILPSSGPVIAFESPPWSTSVEGQGDSMAKGIPWPRLCECFHPVQVCSSTNSVFPQSPPIHGLIPAPSHATSTSSGTHRIDHTWFGWKLSLQRKIILAQRRTLPASLCFRK